MADRKLKIDIRRDKILEQLRREGRVSVAALSSALGATMVTIRNDLSALEREGYLTRIQGGAVLTGDRAGQAPDFARAAQKKAIARAAADLIRDGDTLFINSGTTCQCVAEALKDRKNLNVVTNTLSVAACLKQAPGCRVALLGGVINALYGFTSGADAQEQLGRYQADWAVLSVDGVSAEGGITTYHAEEAVIDRLMLSGARKRLIVADSSKVGRTGFTWVRDCGEDIYLVTAGGGAPESLEALKKQGVRVIVAEEESNR